MTRDRQKFQELEHTRDENILPLIQSREVEGGLHIRRAIVQ